MNSRNAAEIDRATIVTRTAELLAAVNASNVDACLAVWAPDGVLMPPHHPPVQGHQAIGEYFRRLFSQRRFRFTFTSSWIHVAGDIALERVTYTAVVWPGDDAPPIEDAGKGLHVYGRQPDGTWRLTHDIWNSDLSGGATLPVHPQPR